MRIAIIGGGISGLTTIGYFVSPGRTLMKISATILALSLLGGCTASLPPVGTVERVDLQRFMGDWYVIAAIPTFIEKESYRLEADGTIDTTFTFRQGGFDGPVKTYNPRGFIRDTT